MVTISRASHTVLLVLVALLLPATTLRAQGDPGFKGANHIGLGYVANIPTTFIGFSVLGLTPKLFGGAGLYADVKFTTGSPGDSPFHVPDVSVAEAELTLGDQLFQEESDWFSANVAFVYAINGEFAVYAGAGYSKEDHYREYFDDDRERGDLGFYWVSDEQASGTRINLLGGVFFRLAGFIRFQLGVESQPTGATTGVMIIYPF